MEARPPLSDYDEVETLAEMVSRVLYLYSAELGLDLEKSALESPISGSAESLRRSTEQ